MHAMNRQRNLDGLLIMPCYNEEQIITLSLKIITEYLHKAQLPLDILVVDDGSTDRTRELATAFIPHHGREITVLSLDRNSGHQAALLAGIDYSLLAGYEYSISIDCDLQDDLELLPTMIAHSERYHIIAACHSKRRKDRVGKRLTANWFYSIANLLGVELLPHHADFRLLSARAAKGLTRLNHDSLFLRGAIMQLGFFVKPLSYERQSGLSNHRRSRYSPTKMISLALNGIFINTVLPLRIILLASLVLAPLSLAFLAYLLCASWLGGYTVPGWLSLFAALLIGFSLISTCLGVIAEYVARLYKSRTRVSHYQIRDDKHGKPASSSSLKNL
jgi:glycosyltransferase involved in cell wall biosynthesis